MGKLLKPNLGKIGITILLFLLTSFFFVLFTQPETVRYTWLLILIPSYFISVLFYQPLSKHRTLLCIVKWVIFAPFDGYVLGSSPFTLADGLTMIPKSGIPWWPFNQWRFSMSDGARVLPQFQSPPIHEVKAGDLIGYLDPFDRGGKKRSTGTHLRVGITAIPPMFKNGNGEPYKKMDSVFNYLSDEVFVQYQAFIPGLVRREDFIIAKQWRQAHPCELRDNGPNFVIKRVEDLVPEEQDVYVGVGIQDLEGMQKARLCDDPEDFANNPECSPQ